MAQKTRAMPGANRDDESGQYSETYPREAFTDALGELGAAGTQEVADNLGCSYELAYKRLREMENDGEVESRRVGNARLWSVADDE